MDDEVRSGPGLPGRGKSHLDLRTWQRLTVLSLPHPLGGLGDPRDLAGYMVSL